MPQTVTPEVVIDGPSFFPKRSRRKYPGYYPRCQVAKLLKRHKDTLNRWDTLLLIANEDYRKLSLGSRKPWHPFQVELLGKISDYQFRTSDPRINRDEEEILNFIDRHRDIWTEENWIANNYQLPIIYDHNNQRAS